MHHIGCVMRGYQRGLGPNDFDRGFGIQFFGSSLY
jgi:hypothetical protein